jgi:hypothetical protein
LPLVGVYAIGAMSNAKLEQSADKFVHLLYF